MNKVAMLSLCLVGLCLGSESNPIKLASLLKSSGAAPAFQTIGGVRTHAKASRGVTAAMQEEDAATPDSSTTAPESETWYVQQRDKDVPESLKTLGMALNPVVGYYDPLSLATADFWDQGQEATIGFLRHAEIKHGRVAMAAFVGYCLQSNGIIFPWKLTASIPFSDIAAAGSPPEQWDALPTGAKLQILLFIGFLEFWGESRYILENDGLKHYMRGGVPGKFPSFDKLPHPVPFNLYDPFGLNKKKSREVLDKKLLAELNNGRLAQLGIMAFLAEQKVPGSVPALSGFANLKPYAGEIMAPFASGDVNLAFVEQMLKVNPLESVSR
jgi:hypothetical protein